MVGEPGLTAGEHLVLKLHQHWKTVLGPVLVLALIIAATLVVLILVPGLVAPARRRSLRLVSS